MRFLKIIKAEIKKTWRNRLFQKLIFGFLVLIILFTLVIFSLRWTKTGSQLTKNFIRQNPKLVYNFKKILKLYDLPYLIYHLFPSRLPQYELTISQKNLQQINENLPQAGKLLREEHKKTVKAELKKRGGDKKYNVTARYRGDKQEHWMFDKKSWRINVKKDSFEGKKSFNLIIPEDRGYLTESLSFHIAEKLGLFTLENELVELHVNGFYEGVYLMVEHWGEEAVEKNKLEPDTNLYGEADFEKFPQNIYSDVKNFQKYVAYSGRPEDDFSDLELLLDYLNNLSDEEFYQKIGQILDIENFLTWQAHSALFFSYTSDYKHNANLIFNRAKGKLQFIPWDLGVKDPDDWQMMIDYNPLVKKILANPYFLCRRNKILLDYVNKDEELKDDLKFLENLYEQSRASFYKDGKKNFLNFDFDFRVKNIRSWPQKAREKIKKELADTGEICQQRQIPKDPRLLTFNQNYPIFTRQDEEKYLLSAGSYYIKQNIIIPSGLEIMIQPGAKLYFAPGVSLLSYSKITALGKEDKPILFSSSTSQPWGVLALVDMGASGSTFSNIVLENASEGEINRITFTGGLAAYYADTTIKDSTFRLNNGDDAVNIKYGKGEISNCLFENNKFDSIDFDYNEGKIEKNSIFNSGNDGIDLGSASPLVFENIIKDCGDKGISIGELSRPEIKANTIENCDIGIAVKDSSQPDLLDNLIINNRMGLYSYQKKTFFERKEFEFHNNHFINNKISWELTDGVGKEKNNKVQ